MLILFLFYLAVLAQLICSVCPETFCCLEGQVKFKIGKKLDYCNNNDIDYFQQHNCDPYIPTFPILHSGQWYRVSVCMYAGIEVALHGIANEIGRSTGPGEGAHQKSGSNVPTPHVPSVRRHSPWHIFAHLVCFL